MNQFAKAGIDRREWQYPPQATLYESIGSGGGWDEPPKLALAGATREKTIQEVDGLLPDQRNSYASLQSPPASILMPPGPDGTLNGLDARAALTAGTPWCGGPCPQIP